MLRAFRAGCLFILLSPTLWAGDLESLQGQWEMSFQQQGRPLRVVKTIEGNRETVDVFDGEKLLKQHVVEFELETTDRVKIFTYRHGRVTRGHGTGQQVPDGSFIYRLSEDRWIGVYGVLRGDMGPGYTAEYRRVAWPVAPQAN